MRKHLTLAVKTTAMLFIGISLVFMAGVLWPLQSMPVPETPNRILIKNTTVIDVETGTLLPGHDILISGRKIAHIGPNLKGIDTAEIDGSGTYATPGLFDMHTHSIKMSPALMHPLYIASGVTSVRDMGGCMGLEDSWVACRDDKRLWDAGAKSGTLVSPHYDRITGLAINGGGEIPDGLDIALGAGTPDGAKARVRYDKARGMDFLKTYTEIPRDAYFALAEEASRQGIPLAGHLPVSVSALEAIAAGQRSFEHAFLFITECYPGMANWRASGNALAIFDPENRLPMIRRHDTALCDTLFTAMRDKGVAFVPTHTTRKLDAYATDPVFLSDSRLKYIPAPLKMMWLDDADRMAKRAGNDGQDSFKQFYTFGIELTGRAHRAGVPVFVGTDAPDSFAFPGLGIQDEMQHLLRAGLTPLEVIQAATIKPATFMGLENRAGVLQEGTRADILLLDQNPLEDLTAFTQPHAVVLAGTLYDRAALKDLRQKTAQNAGHWSMWPKFIWQLLTSPIMQKQFAD